MELYLTPTYFIDSKHPDVVAYATLHTREKTTSKEKAIALYYAVRDGFLYAPIVDLRH